MTTIEIFAESTRDRESGHVFWYATMRLKDKVEHFIRLNGIHSGQEQDMTTTDGGVLDAISSCLNKLNRNQSYNIDVYSKRNRNSLQKTLLSIEALNASDYTVGSGKHMRSAPDEIALKTYYNCRKLVNKISFFSSPDCEIVKDMDYMANSFKDSFLIESGYNFPNDKKCFAQKLEL